MAIVPDRGRPTMPVDPHYFSKMELMGSGKLVNSTASNTTNFPMSVKGILVETAGDIAFVNPDGTVTVITAVAGQTIPVVSPRINVTGTTATWSGIV